MPTRRILLLLLGVTALSTRVARADWLVFFAGGVRETRGSWEVRGQQIRFVSPSGTLMSIRADEVDLAASAFLSWQVGDRRAISSAHPPAGAEFRPAPDAVRAAAPPPCEPAKVVTVDAAETLEIATGGGDEVVHLACVDAPDADHRLPELAYFGQSADQIVQELAAPSSAVCVTEENPPLVDRSGHRIVYLRLRDGSDLGEVLVRAGLALARSGACARRDDYVAAEQLALAQRSGHWGTVTHDLSLAIVGLPSGARRGSKLPPPRRFSSSS